MPSQRVHLSGWLLLDHSRSGDIVLLSSSSDTYASIHTWAVIVAGIFVLIALTLSTFLIFEHLTSYKKPEEQKWLLGVIFMVPVYSVESLVALWNPKLSLVCDILRNCYEAFALYSFGCYLIACLGGEERVVEMLERQAVAGPRTPLLVRSRSSGKAAVKHPIPLNCCLTPWSLGHNFYHIVKFGIVQYMILKTLCSFLALFLNIFGAYGDGEFKWYYGYPYLTVILNFSQTWALYCLVQFYAVTKDELHPIKPLAKFICFKSIVFATWWQGVGIALLFGSGAAKGLAPEGTKLQASLQDFIICIEMSVAAVAHIYCFPARPYQLMEDPGQRRVAVLSDYASMDSPLDPDEVKESERRSILRFLPPEMENVATSLKESVQDVVMVGGEQIVHDVKVTVSQAVEPVEKGINRINDTLHQLPGHLAWHGREKREEERKKQGSSSSSRKASKDDYWVTRSVRGIDDPLLAGSLSDSGLLRGKKYQASSGAESSGESSNEQAGPAGFMTSGRRWTVRVPSTMSLALLRSSYSSDEEQAEQEEEASSTGEQSEGGEEDGSDEAQEPNTGRQQLTGVGGLPTAAAAFAEVTGLPDFLVHSVVVGSTPAALDKKESKKTPPADAVIRAKPQLVSPAPSTGKGDEGGSNASPPRSLRPPNPPLEDAAALLRVCVPCGVPKVFSGDKMVCPQCKDRAQQAETLDKRRTSSSKVKDKERSKRMKGQSSHATWKSETEMALRQQFD